MSEEAGKYKFKNFCQSCAMPLEEKIYGTNEDGTKNEEFCIYCYKNGKNYSIQEI